MLNNCNVKEHGSFFVHYLKVNFNASKFTENNSFIDSAHFSRTALLQKSQLSAELALNIFTGWLDFKSFSDYYVDGGTGFNMARVARSGGDTSTVLASNWFVEGGVDLKSSDNIGFNGYIRFLDQFSPQTDWGNNSQGHLFFRVGAELYFNPWNNTANRLFARCNYTFATSKDDDKNNFFQLQLGYSVLLSSLFKN
jgi:hypothetical protein